MIKDREKRLAYQRAYERSHRDKMREYQRRWRAKSPTQRSARGFALKRRYGLTMDEWNRLHEQQGGVCAICGLPPSPKAKRVRHLHVDHDHQTGKVRGLVCWTCNYRIAAVESGWLPRIAQYLKWVP